MTKTNPIPGLTNRLKTLYAHTSESPMSNPVAQMGFELSRKLEAGENDLNDFEARIRQFERDAFRLSRSGYLPMHNILMLRLRTVFWRMEPTCLVNQLVSRHCKPPLAVATSMHLIMAAVWHFKPFTAIPAKPGFHCTGQSLRDNGIPHWNSTKPNRFATIMGECIGDV